MGLLLVVIGENRIKDIEKRDKGKGGGCHSV